ncbi:MAG: hypothetical protein ABI760_11825 [Ferruginibacter sp.]
MLSFIFLLIILLVIWIIIRIKKTVVEVRGHWQHYFDNLKFSSQEFYQTIEATVKAKQVPKLHTSRISYGEGGILYDNREYLRISRYKVVFDVCAAPFGQGFFISSWRGDLPDMWILIISALPFIGKSMANTLSKKTYYQEDTEAMFASLVHQSILEAIDEVTNAHGIRQLSELERTFHNQK